MVGLLIGYSLIGVADGASSSHGLWVKQENTLCLGYLDALDGRPFDKGHLMGKSEPFENVEECKDYCAKEEPNCKGVTYRLSTDGLKNCWMFKDTPDPKDCATDPDFDVYFFHPKNGSEGCTKSWPCPLLFVPGFGSMRLYPNQYNMETYNDCGKYFPPVWVKQENTLCLGYLEGGKSAPFENVEECKDYCAKEEPNCKGVTYRLSTDGLKNCWMFKDKPDPKDCATDPDFDVYFFHPENGGFSEQDAVYPPYVGNQISPIPWDIILIKDEFDVVDTGIEKSKRQQLRDSDSTTKGKKKKTKGQCFYQLMRLEERDDDVTEAPALVTNPGGSWNEAITGDAVGFPDVARGLLETLKTQVYTKNTGKFEDQAHMMVYDWRRAPDELQARSKFCRSMKEHVERLFKNTGKRVVLMGHSYGGLLIFSCTQWIMRHAEMGGPEWIREYVEAYAPANSPLLGAIDAITQVFAKLSRKSGFSLGGWSSMFMKRTFRSIRHFYPKGGDMVWGPRATNPIAIVDKSTRMSKIKLGASDWCERDELRLGPKDLTKTLCSAPRGPDREKDEKSPEIYDVLNLKLPPFRRVMLFGDSGIDTTSTVHLVHLKSPIRLAGQEAHYYEKTVDKTPYSKKLALAKPAHEKSKLGDGTVPLLSQIYPARLWQKELYAYPGEHKTEIHFKIQKKSLMHPAKVIDLNVELLEAAT